MQALTIRPLRADDIDRIAATAGGPAWNADPTLWQSYVADAGEDRRLVLIALRGEQVIGYGSLVWVSDYPPFAAAGIPEINNLVVAASMRGRGIGSALIRHLEQSARAAGRPVIGIGVGLYADYGAAQRLYVGLGYVPDGRGVTHGTTPVAPGATVAADDDLILWLTRRL